MPDAPQRLTEEQLAALQVTHKKIATIDWSAHVLVFRRPNRDECHGYRVKLEHPETKADANEQLLQQLIVAFDAEQDANKARVYFTTVFLEEHPMFGSTPRVRLALGALMGMFEDEDLADLGKGVTIRPSPPPRTPPASPTGSATAPAASS